MDTTQEIMINPNLQSFKLTSEMVDSIVQPWRKLVEEIEAERDKAREQVEVCRGIIKRTEIARNSALTELTEMERERDEAREALAAAKHYLTKERDDALAQIVQAECRAERFCQERDEAREAIVGWENKWKCAIEMAAKAEVERDEARDLAQQMSESNQVLMADVRFYRKAFEDAK